MKIALVGFGHIGKKHVSVIQQYPELQLVAIIDSDKSKQNQQSYPANVPFFQSLNDMFDSGIETNIVSIATPNGSHCILAIEALNSGCEVVIEKPMGLSKSECEAVVFKALQVQKNVFVVKQNRYSPPSVWLKKMVDEQLLGKIHMVQINCYWNRDERYYQPSDWKGTMKMDGGCLYTQFSHFIDIMYWIFGDIQNISSQFADFNHQDQTEFEDSGIVHFEFINGGLGSINFSTSAWDKNMESSITVVAEHGSIRVGGQYMEKIDYCHVSNYTFEPLPLTNSPNNYGSFSGSAANHHLVYENVINTIKGNDTITANALEGMKVVDIIERIYRSANRPNKTIGKSLDH